MTKPAHRISYTTPKGRVKNNILIEAGSREEAEAEFFREFGFPIVCGCHAKPHPHKNDHSPQEPQSFRELELLKY